MRHQCTLTSLFERKLLFTSDVAADIHGTAFVPQGMDKAVEKPRVLRQPETHSCYFVSLEKTRIRDMLCRAYSDNRHRAMDENRHGVMRVAIWWRADRFEAIEGP